MALAPIDLEPTRRAHTPAEFRLDLCVHIASIAAGIVGAAVLLTQAIVRGDFARVSSSAIYATCLIAMFSASAAYNLGYGSRYRAHFRRLDHSAILLMIAGTYTPFLMSMQAGLSGKLILAAVWSIALGGVAMKFVAPVVFERLSVALYLGLGWAGVLALWPLVSSWPAGTATALYLGGALYTIGVVFHLCERMPFQNAIWHMFVLAAASCHYASILTGVVRADM